jgi:hypothetical protein
MDKNKDIMMTSAKLEIEEPVVSPHGDKDESSELFLSRLKSNKTRSVSKNNDMSDFSSAAIEKIEQDNKNMLNTAMDIEGEKMKKLAQGREISVAAKRYQPGTPVGQDEVDASVEMHLVADSKKEKMEVPASPDSDAAHRQEKEKEKQQKEHYKQKVKEEKQQGKEEATKKAKLKLEDIDDPMEESLEETPAKQQPAGLSPMKTSMTPVTVPPLHKHAESPDGGHLEYSVKRAQSSFAKVSLIPSNPERALFEQTPETIGAGKGSPSSPSPYSAKRKRVKSLVVSI